MLLCNFSCSFKMYSSFYERVLMLDLIFMKFWSWTSTWRRNFIVVDRFDNVKKVGKVSSLGKWLEKSKILPQMLWICLQNGKYLQISTGTSVEKLKKLFKVKLVNYKRVSMPPHTKNYIKRSRQFSGNAAQIRLIINSEKQNLNYSISIIKNFN